MPPFRSLASVFLWKSQSLPFASREIATVERQDGGEGMEHMFHKERYQWSGVGQVWAQVYHDTFLNEYQNQPKNSLALRTQEKHMGKENRIIICVNLHCSSLLQKPNKKEYLMTPVFLWERNPSIPEGKNLVQEETLRLLKISLPLRGWMFFIWVEEVCLQNLCVKLWTLALRTGGWWEWKSKGVKYSEVGGELQK